MSRKYRELFNKRLNQIGERRIEELLEEYYPTNEHIYIGIGDDAAAMQLDMSKKELLVVTADPCPLPVAWILGDKDFYYYGWYSILINASDLAAMGAKPDGIVLSVIAPEDMPFSDFLRLLEGTKDASKTFKCPVVGGNLKDGKEFQVTGTAFGVVQKHRVLRREGARPGDLLVVVGDMGLFWAGVLATLLEMRLSKSEWNLARRNIRKPRAKVREGQILSKYGLASSCIDNSDGLSSCLYQLASVNQLDFSVDWRAVHRNRLVEKVARAAQVELTDLWNGWGDWQLVITVPRDKLELVRSTMASVGTPVSVIGEVKAGNGQIIDQEGKVVPNKDSERFSGNSYFSHGLDAYMKILFADVEGLDKRRSAQQRTRSRKR